MSARAAVQTITTHVVHLAPRRRRPEPDYEEGNDGRFPDDSPVEVRYPRSRREEHGERSK
jgi:hypothetical protein